MTTLQDLQDLHSKELQKMVTLNDEQANELLNKALTTKDLKEQYVAIFTIYNGYDNIFTMSKILKEKFKNISLLIRALNSIGPNPLEEYINVSRCGSELEEMTEKINQNRKKISATENLEKLFNEVVNEIENV